MEVLEFIFDNLLEVAIFIFLIQWCICSIVETISKGIRSVKYNIPFSELELDEFEDTEDEDIYTIDEDKEEKRFFDKIKDRLIDICGLDHT